jgi:pullulanase/glycogen debranching enzyme
MGKGDDDTIYCNVQMPLLPGRELLNLVNALRESGAHPNLDLVFQHM